MNHISGGGDTLLQCSQWVVEAAGLLTDLPRHGGGGGGGLGGGGQRGSTRARMPRRRRWGPARWSDRWQCLSWRANSLENIVPENLPRLSAHRRFNSITAAAERAPILGSLWMVMMTGKENTD
uniref:Uncharacterized protein n=1 Tax=Oryza meridionalis TaxID=40149 RepID=A0A0E0E6S1_9ORYZ